MFKWKACYTRAGANAAVRRWRQYAPNGGDRPSSNALDYRVFRCMGSDGHCDCPCAGNPPFRKA